MVNGKFDRFHNNNNNFIIYITLYYYSRMHLKENLDSVLSQMFGKFKNITRGTKYLYRRIFSFYSTYSLHS